MDLSPRVPTAPVSPERGAPAGPLVAEDPFGAGAVWVRLRRGCRMLLSRRRVSRLGLFEDSGTLGGWFWIRSDTLRGILDIFGRSEDVVQTFDETS